MSLGLIVRFMVFCQVRTRIRISVTIVTIGTVVERISQSSSSVAGALWCPRKHQCIEHSSALPSLHTVDCIMSETTFVPLNDVRAMKRSSSVGSGSDYGLEGSGEHNTTDYRLQATDSTGSRKISLWHDVSLVHLEPETRKETDFHNFVCEIPKFSRYVKNKKSAVMIRQCFTVLKHI